MKPSKLISKILFLGAAIALLLPACKKEEVRAVLAQPNGAASFTVSTGSVTLSSANDSSTVVSFTWPAVKYGYDAIVTYSLQFDVPRDTLTATPWSGATNVTVGVDELNMAYLGTDFNTLANKMGLTNGTADTLLVRLKSDVNQTGGTASAVPSVYSDTYVIIVTSYHVVISYPTWWVPGDYQGWNAATAATLASPDAKGDYEGYIYIPQGGTYQFKFTSGPDFSHTNYGDGGKDVPIAGETVPSNSGILSTDGGAGNLTVPTGGYYKMTADSAKLTWTALSTAWSIIGDATPTGWGSGSTGAGGDTDMKYDPTAQTWSVTVQLTGTVGTTNQFKFRANHDWTLAFGVDAKGNLSAAGNAGNISVPSTGNYTVTLDLHTPGNYVYSLKKN
jgi:hypothetical protein